MLFLSEKERVSAALATLVLFAVFSWVTVLYCNAVEAHEAKLRRRLEDPGSGTLDNAEKNFLDARVWCGTI